MLGLKRLYWNCRVFGGGKRKGRCPYEHLGLKRPSYDFGSLLQEEMKHSFCRGEGQGQSENQGRRGLT